VLASETGRLSRGLVGSIIINDEQLIMWKELVMYYLKLLSRYASEEAEGNYEKR
jgi:hypothetical protein